MSQIFSLLFTLTLCFLNAMATDQSAAIQMPRGPDGSISKIIINGEEYIPTPHKVNPDLPENMVWSQFPYHSSFLSDPNWFNALGEDPIVQRRIWAIPNEAGQIDQFRQLLHERPDRGLDLMYAAAVKGKAYIIKCLLAQGVKATANEAEGDPGSCVPLHAAAYQGRFDCVKILMDEGNLGPNILDDIGGTPLMRANWGKHPEIVQYLLEAGADLTIRQQPPPNGELGTNAFEFACGSGCLECARLLFGHALSLGMDVSTLITRTAVAAAAASENPEMFQFILEHGGYPLPDENGEFTTGITLSADQKSALEYPFEKSLRQISMKTVQSVFKYLNSTNPDSTPNFPSLADSTIETLIDVLTALAGRPGPDPISNFTFIHSLLFTPSSRFTNPATQSNKATILNDAFFWAAQNDQLEMLKHIYSLYPELDVNHLSKTLKPFLCTPLSMSRESVDVMKWLFETFDQKIDIHKGVGKFVNGPTALWIAVGDEKMEAARILLENGGPVEERRTDGLSYEDVRVGGTKMVALVMKDENGEVDWGKREMLVLSVANTYRSPVVLWSETAWRREFGDPSKTGKGQTFDGEGNELKYVVLEVGMRDGKWLMGVKIRKSDEQLLAEEKNGRELMPNPGGL